MLTVDRLSVSIRCSIRTMRQIYLLLSMLMECSISGRGIDNFEEDTGTAVYMDDVISIGRRQSTERVHCSRTRNVEHGSVVSDENTDHMDKILGGERIDRGTIPWQVSVFNNNEYKCSGVILSEFWILTSAECVDPCSSSREIIKVGDFRMMNDDDGERTIQKAGTIIHGFYDRSTKAHNLALIKVKKSSDGRGIRFNNYTQPICLPLTGERPSVGTELTISGWGRESRFGSEPNVLKRVVLPVFNHTECRTSIYTDGRITNNILCAGMRNGDSNVCLGDTGAPAVYVNADVYILAGIVSMTSDCEAPHNPVILSDIQQYRKWIMRSIKVYSSRAERRMPNRNI